MADSRGQQPDAGGAPRQNDAIRQAQLDAWLDQALADTFPASDPVASPPDAMLTAGAPAGDVAERAARLT
jgi:hypothetical protein